MTRDTEFSVSGVPGRFRFLDFDPRGWINAYGGKDSNHYKLRAFAPERVKTVHRTHKMKDLA